VNQIARGTGRHDTVWLAEVLPFDAPTLMGYVAGKAERVEIGSGASCAIYSRTPTLTAMTAAGLDSGPAAARCSASARPGPQVTRVGTACPTTSPWPGPGDRGHLPLGVAPRGRAASGTLQPPLPRPGHRPRQAAQADQPPGARADSRSGWPRSGDKNVEMAAEIARAGCVRALPRSWTPSGAPNGACALRQGQAGRPSSRAADDRRGIWPSRTSTSATPARRPGGCPRCTSAAWARAARILQHRFQRYGYATWRPPCRTSTWDGKKPRPPPRCRRVHRQDQPDRLAGARQGAHRRPGARPA